MSNTKYKIDLHSHSIISYDGGISKKKYKKLLDTKILDFIAITDHNEIRFAKAMQADLGPQIIVGEEIRTLDGEIIGLFLNNKIESGKSALETVGDIHFQGGVVYIPHPFESKRSSLSEDTIKEIIGQVDIIEVFNARGKFRGKPDDAKDFALTNNIAMASSSDSHCFMGAGTAFNVLKSEPTQKNLVNLLKKAKYEKTYAPIISYLCPAINKIKNKIFL